MAVSAPVKFVSLYGASMSEDEEERSDWQDWGLHKQASKQGCTNPSDASFKKTKHSMAKPSLRAMARLPKGCRPHRNRRAHRTKRTSLPGGGSSRKWSCDDCIPMEQDQYKINRAFIQFSSLSLLVLSVSVIVYLLSAQGAQQAKNSTVTAVTGELVLCIDPCHGASRDAALVRRGPPGSTDAKDVLAAMSRLPRILSFPRECRQWPLQPFEGPFVALVSTRPQNAGRRDFIRMRLAAPSLHPPGSFRLIFFVVEPKPGVNSSWSLRKALLHESDKHQDMSIEGYALSSMRAMILEWAPEFAVAPRLVLWARDDAQFDARALLARMKRLAQTPGDVFGRVSASANLDAAMNKGANKRSSPWHRLEQCAYFLKMAALVRLSSVYEDVPRGLDGSDEFELVTPSLAARANLSLVAIDGPSPCLPPGRTVQPTSSQTSKRVSSVGRFLASH
ncbi:uncharacterized protein [Dermacentor albipictus]|uniref:uncharacterized protein isoform X2 n=1 Tax=Dermacentor albipictus TaxID=60249 RepID=UPI0031FD5D31